MLKRFFITGTDTSVGKTVVSRALLQALASQGKTVAGYKPVAKGSKETPEGLRNKDALVLQSVSTIELPYEAVNPIALSEEESSVAHSCPINYTLISNGLANLTEKVDHVVVEGTGGWRSLMNDLRIELKRAVTQRFKRVDLDRFKQEIKEHVTHFLYDRTQRSPIVIPVINVVGGSSNKQASGKPAEQQDPQAIADEQAKRFAQMRAQLLGQDARTD